MTTLSSIQLYNGLANGSIDAAELQTAITTGGRLPNFQELLGDPPSVRGLLAVDDAWNAIKGSDALSQFTNNPTSIRNLFNNTLRLQALLNNNAEMERAIAPTYANQQFAPYYSFRNRMTAYSTPFGLDTINSFAFSGTTYVAVGGSGVVYTSPDGDVWTKRVVAGFGTDTIAKVVFAAGVFVAVTQNNKAGVSSDGITWTVTTPFSAVMYGLVFGAGLFVACGNAGTIFTSPDGTTWTSRTNPLGTANQCFNVVYNGSVFVIAMSNLTNVISSTNGTTWTSRTTGNTNSSVSLGAVNGVFVLSAVSQNRTSTDGVTWTSRTFPIALDYLLQLNSVSNFIIGYGPNYTYWKSTDGVNWISVPSPTQSVSLNGLIALPTKIIGAGSSNLFLTANNTFTELTFNGGSEMLINSVANIKYINNTFFACGNTTTGGISTSTDGKTWKKISSLPVISIAFGNGIYVALGSTTNIVYTSTDLQTWTQRSTAVAVQTSKDIAFGNGMFVLVGDSTVAARSTNGTTWTAISTGVTTPSRIIFGGGQFVVVGWNSTVSQLSTSPNGVTFTARTVVDNDLLNDVIYANGFYIYLSSTANANAYISYDGITWTLNQLVSASREFQKISYSNGVYTLISGTSSPFTVTMLTDPISRPLVANSVPFINGTGVTSIPVIESNDKLFVITNFNTSTTATVGQTNY